MDDNPNISPVKYAIYGIRNMKIGFNIRTLSEVEDAGATALHLAAAKGFTNVARLLIMVGANCEHIDQQGRTPIFYACLGGQAHTLSVMVTELNCKITHTDKLGRTALHCAAFGGYIACIEVLIMKADFLIHKEDLDQFTPIHIACERGKYDCVKYLLKCGAAVNALARIDDCTPLSCAQANGHQQIVNYLLRNGGLFPYQLRNLAALIIQKWWRQHLRSRQLNNQKPKKRKINKKESIKMIQSNITRLWSEIKN
ncbi:hypothetical protein LOAG_10571 [Loa loa]|uniref:Uncharacterized protein n=1 Tax=Loa loa TaxID=7209 RepID=A0A1S0TQV2_LOALO|nr:hypothetical protein LOAG_10571 [Loa loa]EFO17926.1 hypothetical protein LOAG_10571 [Loa loa]